MTEDDTTYRVVQWGTGNVGRLALRAILDHPRLELAGVIVHSDAVPAVCAAPPGLLLPSDLPLITGRGLLR